MANADRTYTISLSAADRQIVEQVIRDRIGTNDTIRCRLMPEKHATTASRITARLVQSGWLSAHPLVHPTLYFVPGKRAVSGWGLPPNRSLPLGPQALPIEFALLRYTTGRHPSVSRLLPDEIQRLVPWYSSAWLNAPHCLRRTDRGNVIELVRVDLGGPADHVARKCRDDIEQRTVRAGFHDFLATNGLSLLVITGVKSKAEAIRAALDQHRWPNGLRIRLIVIPSLLSLLTAK